MLKVVGFPRIHIGLIDLNGETGRAYGGIGFSLCGFPTAVEFTESQEFHIESALPLTTETLEEVKTKARRVAGAARHQFVKVVIKSHAPEHVGLGSKTCLLLAVLSGINRFLEIGLSRAELVEFSGRGRTSGIGVNTFFEGGLIVDCGIHHRPDQVYLPSAFNSSREIALRLARVDIPSTWSVSLITFPFKGLNGEAEKCFFQTVCPTNQGDSFRTLACVYHQIIPGFLTGDIQTLRNALMCISEIGFKRHEIERSPQDVKEVLSALRHVPEIACGLSSTGPTIYVLHRRNPDTLSTLRSMLAKQHAMAELYGPYDLCSSGYRMESA